MPSSHLILCCPLLLLASIFPSIRVFSNESALRIRWPEYWSFSFNISPFNEHPGLISIRMDWLDLLAVQETLKSLLQHHSSKASILWCSAYFIVQLSRPYLTTGKTIALTRWTLVGKVMSLLFNTLSRLVITFLPRSKHLLIPWLQSPSTVILESRKIKTCCIHSPLAHLFVPSLLYVFWAIFIPLPLVSPLHGSALKDNSGACSENSRLEAKLLQILQILICSRSPFMCCVCVCYVDSVVSDSKWPRGLQAPLHGILQARVLEWVAMSSSRGSPWPRDWTCIS